MKTMKWFGILSVVISFVLGSCLNPIGLNPETQLAIKADVSGSEIGIDNINSAELRFVNHTKSMDITNIEILIGGEILKPGNYYSYGDSRINGGPHAGTGEGILERPTGKNSNESVNVTGYRVQISYQKASNASNIPETLENGNPPNLDNGKIEVDIGVFGATERVAWGEMPTTTAKQVATNLLRGKQILHFYRNKAGDLDVSAGDPNGDMNDLYDFVQTTNITNGSTNINLDNIEVAVKSFPKIDVNIPGLENFSTDVLNYFNQLQQELKGISSAILAQAENTLSAAEIIAAAIREGQKLGYGVIAIENHSSKPITLEFSQNESITQHVIVNKFDTHDTITRPGNWTYKWKVDGQGEKERSISSASYTIRQIHFYDTKSGDVNIYQPSSDNWIWNLTNISAIPDVNVNYLNPVYDQPAIFIVRNKSSIPIDVYLQNDFSNDQYGHKENARAGDDISVALKVAQYPDTYNYRLYIKKAGDLGSAPVYEKGIIALPTTSTILQGNTSLNVLEFTDSMLPTVNETITYDVSTDGGPTSTTTAVTLVFSADVPGLAKSNLEFFNNRDWVIGDPVPTSAGNAREYKIPVTEGIAQMDSVNLVITKSFTTQSIRYSVDDTKKTGIIFWKYVAPVPSVAGVALNIYKDENRAQGPIDGRPSLYVVPGFFRSDKSILDTLNASSEADARTKLGKVTATLVNASGDPVDNIKGWKLNGGIHKVIVGNTTVGSKGETWFKITGGTEDAMLYFKFESNDGSWSITNAVQSNEAYVALVPYEPITSSRIISSPLAKGQSGTVKIQLLPSNATALVNNEKVYIGIGAIDYASYFDGTRVKIIANATRVDTTDGAGVVTDTKYIVEFPVTIPANPMYGTFNFALAVQKGVDKDGSWAVGDYEQFFTRTGNGGAFGPSSLTDFDPKTGKLYYEVIQHPYR